MIAESLKVFVTVIEQKNFSRAAELLHLSQPAVSMQIRNLETEFGTKLIHRSSKQVKPTQSGEILFERAKRILQLYDEAKQEIHFLHNIVTGTLKIGASFTIGEYILPRLLAEYAAQYPHVELEVTIANTEEITQAVRSKKLDIGLIEGDVDFPDITVNPFMQDELIIVVPADASLSFSKTIPAPQLQNQIWILRESGSGTRFYQDQLLQELALTMKRSFVFSSSQAVKEAVIAGLGISLLSRWVVAKELTSGELHAVQVNEKKWYRPFSVILPQDAVVTKTMDVFIQKVKKTHDLT